MDPNDVVHAGHQDKVRSWIDVPWLRRLVAGFSPRRPGIVTESVRVGFVVYQVALGQVFLRVFRFILVSIILPWLSMLIYHLRMNNISVGNRSSVSRVAQSVQCLATGWTTWQSGFDPRHRRKDVFCGLCVAHPASCKVATEGSFPGAKSWPGSDA
jgi:hypothetical protein